MYAAWRLTRFLLQALKVPANIPAAVLDGSPCHDARQNEDDQLLCVSQPAEVHGVQAGMRVSQALARCPTLQSFYRDEAAEKQLHELLLHTAETWTADFESTQPGICILDLRRVYRLQNTGWLDQGMLMHQDMRSHGYELRIGFGGNPDLALLASHIAFPVRVIAESFQEEKKAFEELPLFVLSPSPDLIQTLNLWGISTVAELKALKRQSVGERLGPDGLRLWDLAQGGKDRLLKLVRPDIEYKTEVELEHGIETLEPLLHLLRDMVAKLCAKLSLAWKVAAHLHLKLRFDDEVLHRKDLRIAEPTRDVEVLLRLLGTYLESVTSSAPVVYLSLEITAVDPAAAQDLLFERGLRDPGKFAETLSALEALLGQGRTGRGQLLPTHQPDSFVVLPFLDKSPAFEAAHPNPNHGLPLQRFRPPWTAEVRLENKRPVWVGAGLCSLSLIDCQGPWLLSGHWWDERQAWNQEIWDVAAHNGELYRLVRERGTWRLEGRYG